MPARTPMAYWFAKDQPIETHYTEQMDWLAVNDLLAKRLHDTTIGWVWLQRRGSKKLTPSRLKAELRSDIEVYRKPSIATPADIVPSELIGWTRPAERKLAQLDLSRKDLGENPLWDVWVRITPPVKPTVFQERQATQYIKDKTAQDRAAEAVQKIVEHNSAVHPLQLEAEDMKDAPAWMRERAEKRWRDWRADRLITLRLNRRWGGETRFEARKRMRAQAIAKHEARIEAGRLRTARMNNGKVKR